MPRARKKKNSSFQTTITKSVFLYGRPNKEKLVTLQQMQNSYTALINRNIELLEKNPAIVLQLVKNDKKDPEMQKLEKAIRPKGINSAFCQNAFDAAVVQVSSRLNNIRFDLLSEGMGIFAQSKVLFAMSIMGCSKQKIKKTVTAYVDSISKDTLTAIERLDIKEFNKSRKMNGMFSTFARGKLQRKLMEALNQKGCDFFEVEPDFTSQVCPVCSNLNGENRHSKGFCCTNCGYQDDADPVGAVNIRNRASDKEILELCKENQYNHKNLQNAIKIVYEKRHVAYKEAQAASA